MDTGRSIEAAPRKTVSAAPSTLERLMFGQAWFWARAGLGAVLFLAGVVISRGAFNTWGADFAPQYMSAWLLREGKNVYDFQIQHDGYMRYIGEVTTWAHFHPPGAAVIALPATLLPYPVARQVWFVVAIAVMVVGLWRFMAAYVPGWDRSHRALVIGLVMCAAATRWGFKVAQPGSIVLGLFGLFLAELKAGRAWSAFLCGSVVAAMKVTFGLPFFLMALALRRFKLTVAMWVFVVAVNLVGLFGMGGPSILADYRANFAQFERPDQLNYPDPRGFNSLARTDWAYLLNAVSPSFARSNKIAVMLTLVCLIWLGLEVWRAGGRARDDVGTLALTGSLAAMSMLAVYHHHYDMTILLLPTIAYLGVPQLRRIRASWAFAVPVALYAGLYPYDKFAKLVQSLIGDSSVLFTKPLACVVCITAFVSGVLVFRAACRAPTVAPGESRATIP
jgi:hypothetical protein